MYAHEIPILVESFKPLCVRAWPYLNTMLAMNRDAEFQHRDYITVMGRHFTEEAPSVTFVRFLNDMERLKEIRSETYERNITRIARVHALNRVANIMPKVYHFDTSGKLKPGQTIAEAKWADVLACREVTGIHSIDQLLELAGLS